MPSRGRIWNVTHYQERLEKDLHEIQSGLKDVAELVQEQVGDSVKALMDFDHELANEVILKDRIVNRATRDLDNLCYGFMVRHLPVGQHLRYMSAVLHLDLALERIGDYAATVCRHSQRCSAPPPPTVARDIELIAQQARSCLAEALAAFQEHSVDLARKTLGLTYNMDSVHDNAIEDLVANGERNNLPVRDLFGYIKALYFLLRVSDQAENIARETLFAFAGEGKDPKTYRILFVDRANDCRALIAEAYCRRTFPNSGSFASAGWDPADSVRPEVIPFFEEHGLSMEDLQPKGLPDLMSEPKHFHVIIGLDEKAREMIGEIPYKTVFLHWDLGPCPFGENDPNGMERLEGIYREIASRMKDLMQILVGPNAA
jgi:phosphate transport system protein